MRIKCPDWATALVVYIECITEPNSPLLVIKTPEGWVVTTVREPGYVALRR